MLFGAVCLHTSLAVIITHNKAAGSRMKSEKRKRDKRRRQKKRGQEEKREGGERCPANACVTKPLCM